MKSDCWNSADSNVLWECAVVELHAELREFPFPWSSLLLRGALLWCSCDAVLTGVSVLYLVHCFIVL